jgi:hypothetical protein
MNSNDYTQNPFLSDKDDCLAALEAKENKHMDSIGMAKEIAMGAFNPSHGQANSSSSGRRE